VKDLAEHFSRFKRHEIAVVGDRVLTDVVLGNNFGLSILVTDIVTSSNDNKMASAVKFKL
jgi:predicted HAD superfamily phosphohydrolase YqeG